MLMCSLSVVFTVLVPALLVTHVMIALILIRRRDREPHRLTQRVEVDA